MLMTTTENIFAPTPDRRVKRGWMNLRVSHVIHETPDTDTFLMVDAEENKRAFDYIAGQYLTFRFDDVADKPIVRSYTMSSSPCQPDTVAFTVKRVEKGLISNWLCDNVRTGSILRARGGAHVVHVDSSKTSVAWARENAEISQLAAKPIRWIVEDVRKFVQREVRRGSKYHGIILDPPTYGRGGNAEIWQIEDHLPPLLDDLEKILADDFSFVMLCAHSNGYTPLALKNLVHDMLRPRAKLKCDYFAEEMLVEEMMILEKGDGTAPGNRPGDSANQRLLPSGAMCLTVRK